MSSTNVLRPSNTHELHNNSWSYKTTNIKQDLLIVHSRKLIQCLPVVSHLTCLFPAQLITRCNTVAMRKWNSRCVTTRRARLKVINSSEVHDKFWGGTKFEWLKNFKKWTGDYRCQGIRFKINFYFFMCLRSISRAFKPILELFNVLNDLFLTFLGYMEWSLRYRHREAWRWFK